MECELGQLPMVNVEHFKLRRILTYLLQNAREAIEARIFLPSDESSKGYIKVKTGTEDQSVFVEIVDNGIGLEEDELTQVFARGFTTKARGLGFGLHYSANAMTEMSGDISIQSGPKQGACVRLSFPLKD